MGNTGNVIVQTIKQVNTGTGQTVSTKANIPGTEGYIKPYFDATACPVTYDLSCPARVIATAKAGTIEFEFSLYNAQVKNPQIKTVAVRIMEGGTVASSVLFDLTTHTPPNYFHGSAIGLTTDVSYTIRVEYLNAAGTVLKTCSDGVSYTPG